MATKPDSGKYVNAEFTCKKCQYQEQLDTALVQNLITTKPIKCSACDTKVQLGEADREALVEIDKKNGRIGKVALMIGAPFFLTSLVLSLLYGPVASIPCVLVGFVLGAMLKAELSSVGVVSISLEPEPKP